MKIDEIFDQIMNLVSENLEVSKDAILSSCKKEEFIDARCMVVHYCKKIGMPTDLLMRRLNKKSHQSILNLLTVYDNRLQNNCFRYFDNKVKKHLANFFQEIGMQ